MIIFDRRDFVENFKYYHSNHGCALSNQATNKSNPTSTTFEQIYLLYDNLSLIFIKNQNICIATVALPLAVEKFSPAGTKFFPPANAII